MFEVPYETPFIAITEKAFGQLVNEQYEVLQRGIATHKRLERLVVEERGLDEVVRALSAAIGGAVLVLDPRGEPLASRAFRRELSEEAVRAVREQVLQRRRHRVRARPPRAGGPQPGRCRSPPGRRARPRPGWWPCATPTASGDFERLICQQATTVVALELMRQRAMRDTERRLAGDVIADAVSGPPRGPRAGRAACGRSGWASTPRWWCSRAAAASTTWSARWPTRGAPAWWPRATGLLVAVADGARAWPTRRSSRRRCSTGVDAERAAVSRVAEADALRRSFHEARLALEAAALANGGGPQVGSWRDLGAFQLLLSVQDDDALRLFCDSVLGPLEEGGREYGDELVRSLEAFIECNGQWERAARQLFCHRHTLRYRIRRVEELTGRDLSRAQDRIEFWLALRARELVAE